MRVIVVDDQAVFRRAARAVVDAAAGFESVGEAGSGPEAIALADETDPDVVLIDVRMPGMNGVDAARQLVASHPTAMVVLISAGVQADVQATIRRSGAAAFIAKADLSPQLLRRIWADRIGYGRPP